MLDKLPTLGENHLAQREYMVNRHARMMQKIMDQNIAKAKYWILGWVESSRKAGKTRIKPRMQAMDTIPDVTKESYLYEVDNTAGTKTLLWVMHPNNKLSLPSIGKSIHVADAAGG
jgi:hypothetical protein